MRGFKSSWIIAGLLLLAAQAQALEKASESLKSLQKMSDGFAELAAQVKPGVVAIATERKMEASSRFFHQGQPRDGAGSGVMVHFKGENYILTNNHVIDGAANIRVELPDSRFFDAEIVGADSLSDLALLKVDGQNLPAVKLGDSDILREGEWVLAIGNPFGFSHSITTGIISALGRDRSRDESG
jgi:serine protease DegQ